MMEEARNSQENGGALRCREICVLLGAIGYFIQGEIDTVRGMGGGGRWQPLPSLPLYVRR